MSKEEFKKAVLQQLKEMRVAGIDQADVDEEVECYYFYVERFLKGIKTFPSIDKIVEACANNIKTWY